MDELAAAFPDGLTRDRFLGGRLVLTQPKSGYRAGVDPVFLAAALAAKRGNRVLDLGCGVGTAALCLGTRVPGLTLHGVEFQAPYAALARQNGHDNTLAFDVWTDDLFAPAGDWARESYDIVLTNPPFFEDGTRTPSPDAGRETALGEARSLEDWLAVAIRRLAPGGHLGVVQRAERLGAILRGFGDRVGAVGIHPLTARAGRPARLVIVTARKGARAPLTLFPAQVLHIGERHLKDGESYVPEVSAVLRDGAPWPWLVD